MGSQKVRHNLATEQQQKYMVCRISEYIPYIFLSLHLIFGFSCWSFFSGICPLGFLLSHYFHFCSIQFIKYFYYILFLCFLSAFLLIDINTILTNLIEHLNKNYFNYF